MALQAENVCVRRVEATVILADGGGLKIQVPFFGLHGIRRGILRGEPQSGRNHHDGAGSHPYFYVDRVSVGLAAARRRSTM